MHYGEILSLIHNFQCYDNDFSVGGHLGLFDRMLDCSSHAILPSIKAYFHDSFDDSSLQNANINTQ